jgi:hypothetical protein
MASNQHSTREKIDQLLPKTYSPDMDYSLFIIVTVLVMLERVEMRSGMAPAAFPPPIFGGSASVSWLCVSPPPPRENALGVS